MFGLIKKNAKRFTEKRYKTKGLKTTPFILDIFILLRYNIYNNK